MLTPAPSADANLSELQEWLEIEVEENKMWRALYSQLSHEHKLLWLDHMLLETQLATVEKALHRYTNPPNSGAKKPPEDYPTIF